MISQSWSNRGMSLWWISVVLLFAATHAIECLQMCSCQQPKQNELKVDCGSRTVNQSILVHELDLLLSEEELREHLTSLNVSNTLLTRVPASICNLKNLTSLNLDGNRLTRLPDNCFTNIRALQYLSARGNYITQLQDGLFDGLNSLIELQLDDNQIKAIGLRVFSNQSDLVNLKKISLARNKLCSLEPWPIIRGLHGSQESKVSIDLGQNSISNFTNNIHWQFDCSMLTYVRLWLLHNKVRHFTDMAVGWDLPLSARLFCLFSNDAKHPSFDLYVQHSSTYTCDCRDFSLQAFQRRFIQCRLLNDIVCNAPPRLANALVIQLPLNELECELSDKCPTSCQCVYRPENATLHVYCSASNLSSLPLELPLLPKSYVRYKLDFSNNKRLRHLEGRPYFVNTSILDVSNCAISIVDINAWKEIAKMQSPFVTPQVCLQNNKIKSLQPDITGINISSIRLTLNHNPWECSCENQWMIDWFKSLSLTSPNGGDASCSSPSRLKSRSITESTRDDFCVDPALRMLKISLLSTLTPVAALVLFGFAVYRVRVQLFRRWKFHPFDRDECVGEDMDYDVFLCCSSEDHNPHGLRILRQMESNGYRVCYHLRDFLAGAPITDNMIQSIESSKRTVCLISPNFLKRYIWFLPSYSQHCIFVILCIIHGV